MQRIAIGMVVLASACSSTGQGWAEDKLGKAGAATLQAETLAFLEGRRAPEVAAAEARCPSPRVVFDYYPADRAPTPRLEYSRVSKLAKDAILIKGVSSVRCVVVAMHEAQGKKRSFKEWMTVRLIDREANTDQLTKVLGNDEELARFLAQLAP